MSSSTTNDARIYMMMEDVLSVFRLETNMLMTRFRNARTERQKRQILEYARKYSVLNKIPDQIKHLDRLLHVTDTTCLANLRMDRNTFGKLCRILSERGGVKVAKCLGIEEQVAIFLGVLAHHNKNRAQQHLFWRSGSTVSFYVNKVLGAVLSLHVDLLTPPVPVGDDCTDHRWKWFKGCLGALDGTHINVLVRSADKPRYRTRKGQIATNTLAVCDRNMQFVYFLPGWEGSAGDSRVLRDAVAKQNGFKVPEG